MSDYDMAFETALAAAAVLGAALARFDNALDRLRAVTPDDQKRKSPVRRGSDR
jgi:hypothetical protein